MQEELFNKYFKSSSISAEVNNAFVFYFSSKQNRITQESEWLIQQEGINFQTEREFETITSTSNGFIGTRNSLEENIERISTPATFVAGVYEVSKSENIQELIKLPDWTRLEVFIDDKRLDLLNSKIIKHKRYLNLQNGTCKREWISVDDIGRITKIIIVKFISIYDKNLCFKRIIVQPQNYYGYIRIRSGIDGQINPQIFPVIRFQDNIINYLITAPDSNEQVSINQISDFKYIESSSQSNFKITGREDFPVNYKQKFINNYAFEEWGWEARIDQLYSITSLVSIFSSVDCGDTEEKSRKYLLSQKVQDLFTPLEIQNKSWNKIWEHQQIQVNGDDDAQKWLNFAVYHLITSGKFSGNKYSIPARTLTGASYKGHVFWDTEIFLLPFYIYTNPEVAKALLMYRYNTLEGARQNAREEGYLGACYAWESTNSGRETTPSEVILPNGEIVTIYSGSHENHISLDISYTIWQYWLVTGDLDFLHNYGAEIIFETSRFCFSYLKPQKDGLYHRKEVVGPDEYHELVDDNAYTNIMVQSNLDICCKLVELFKQHDPQKLEKLLNKINLTKEQMDYGHNLKEKIYTGYDEETKIFEQFKGFHYLENINVKDYEPRSAAMDIILGREKTRKTRIVKQPDVLMFLFLLKERFNFSKNIIKANYEYYEPKTGHGSSLSPSIHSIIASWIGFKEDAYKYFEQNTQIDLGNGMGNAAGGVHIAAIGGTWMATIFGFAGVNINEQGLIIAPHMPDKWDKLSFSIVIKNQPLYIELIRELTGIIIKITHNGNSSVNISIGEYNWRTLEAGHSYTGRNNEWEKWQWIN